VAEPRLKSRYKRRNCKGGGKKIWGEGLQKEEDLPGLVKTALVEGEGDLGV